MRFLIYALIVAAIVTFPFVAMKQPWAVGFWQRVRLVVIIYAIVIFISAVVSLVVRWDDIYG